MTAAASQNQPPATSPTAADTFAWVDAAQSFAEHRARLEHVVRARPITPAQYRRLTGW